VNVLKFTSFLVSQKVQPESIFSFIFFHISLVCQTDHKGFVA